MFEYPIGKIAFKSEKQLTEKELEYLGRLHKAIILRKSLYDRGTGLDSPFRREGCLWIHDHAVAQLVDIFTEISEQQGNARLHIKPDFYIDHIKILVIRDEATKERAMAIIPRNWINPLHNSLLPKIFEVLREAKRILKRQGYNKISLLLMTEQIEAAGQQKLEQHLHDDVYFYSIPYISPSKLDKIIKEKTGIDIGKYYPNLREWSKPFKMILKTFLFKLILRKLWRKGEKGQKKKNQPQYNPHLTQEKQISSYPLLQVGKVGVGVEKKLKWSYHDSELKCKPYVLPRFLHSDKKNSPERVVIRLKIPEDPYLVRISISKKQVKRRHTKKWREPNKFVRYVSKTIYYKRVKTEEGLKQKTFQEGVLRRYHGDADALNYMFHALLNYKPRDDLRLRARDRNFKAISLRIYRIEKVADIGTSQSSTVNNEKSLRFFRRRCKTT